MWLYALLLLGSVVVPLALSFDKKLRFSIHWKIVIPSILAVALVYILFDIAFTHAKVWGFNPWYHLPFSFFGLPIEEIAFFVVIPYASLFIHYAFFYYYPQIHPGKRTGQHITIVIIVISATILSLNFSKAYTAYAMSALLVALLISLFDKSMEIVKLYISFLVILVPFIIVNGVLTGTGIDGEVVWYNNSENLGLRFFTIPVEDFAYGFSLLAFNLLTINLLNKRKPLYHA